MDIFIGIVSTIAALCAILCVLYVVLFVRPRGKKAYNKELLCNYAHRGLHGNGVPENSLQAFEMACERGCGIELDVQLSSDGEVMVFHDYSLLRMTGVDRKLCEMSKDELCAVSLSGTEQKIPRFTDVLRLIDGRVPVLVELKGESLDSSLCEKVAEILRAYKGIYCIESFNPLLAKTMRKYLPEAFYGQLYTNVCRDKNKRSVLYILLTGMVFNFLAKPDFIAYNKEDRNSLPVRLTTGLYKAPKFVWTVKTAGEMLDAEKFGECAIFEE